MSIQYLRCSTKECLCSTQKRWFWNSSVCQKDQNTEAKRWWGMYIVHFMFIVWSTLTVVVATVDICCQSPNSLYTFSIVRLSLAFNIIKNWRQIHVASNVRLPLPPRIALSHLYEPAIRALWVWWGVCHAWGWFSSDGCLQAAQLWAHDAPCLPLDVHEELFQGQSIQPGTVTIISAVLLNLAKNNNSLDSAWWYRLHKLPMHVVVVYLFWRAITYTL